MTDRVISYAGALPRIEDFLSIGKYAMVGVGAVAEAILGQGTQVAGLAVTAIANNAVAGSAFAVNVGRGFIFSFQETDPTAYGVLGADTATNVLKTGILSTGVSLGLANAAPASAGYSTNYLISAAFVEQDINESVLPYYNAATPTQPFSGPANNSAAQVTTRQDTILLQATAGAPAPTGSQTIPSTPAGYVALYIVTVNNGDTATNSAQISVAPNAPFITSAGQLLQVIQSGSINYASAGGSANLITLSLTPALTAYKDGTWVNFKAAGTNSAAAFVSVDGLSNLPVLQGGVALSGGEIQADWSYGGVILSGSFHLLASGAGSMNIASGRALSHAVNMSQFPVRLFFSASQAGIINAPANSTTYTIENITITFPTASKSGAFRANARLVGEGTATAASVRQNFQNILTDGSNSYIGNASLVAALAVGDTWGTADTFLTSGTYAPGSEVTFTHQIRTGGGGSDFTIQNSFMEIIVEEA
jgi:hypothetical protein